jgi:hypothetical protein
MKNMELLKEYIRLIIKEELTEDIKMSRLSPSMVGVYSFAQAINKSIPKGSALPGTINIDIIDAGNYLTKAPMTTPEERKGGTSLQHSRNSFKFYLDPTKTEPELNPGSETHDLVHTFTGYLAKAFARRRQSIEQSGKYQITPSRFNKITIDQKNKKNFNDALEQEYNFRLPDEAFEQAFKYENATGYETWFSYEYGPNINNTVATRRIARHLYQDIKGGDFIPGYLGRKYWAQRIKSDEKPDFSGYSSGKHVPNPFGIKYNSVYNQSTEDEEEIGNKMIEKIGKLIANSKPIENVEKTVDEIINDYTASSGLTKLELEKFKHRWATPEVIDSMTRLFEIYNELLPRYMVAARKAQPENRREMYKNDTKQVSAEQLAAARERYNK